MLKPRTSCPISSRLFHDARQVAERPRDLARHVVHQQQDHHQQQCGRAEMHPHAMEEQVDPRLQKPVEGARDLAPGLCRRVQRLAAQLGDRHRPLARGAVAQGGKNGGQHLLEILAAGLQFERQFIARIPGESRPEIGIDRIGNRRQTSFQQQQFDIDARFVRIRPGRQLHQQIDQLGKAQHDQRHRVIAIEIGIENQVRLVADTRQQPAPGPQCPGLVGGARLLAQRLQCSDELLVELGAVHARAGACLRTLDLPDVARQQALVRRVLGDIEQGIANVGNVMDALDFLAGKVDRDVLLVDQDVGDENDRAQIQEVDQQEFFGNRKAPDQMRQFSQHVSTILVEGGHTQTGLATWQMPQSEGPARPPVGGSKRSVSP